MNENKVTSSFFWKFFERMSSQMINLVVQIILARLIAPKDFGVLAILIVFVNVSTIFVQKGLSSSLIRKKNADNTDYDTAFWTGLVIAIIIYIILFFAAPIIAEIYRLDQIRNGLRVISISLLFGSLYCVQSAILVRNLKFKAIFIRGLISATVSGTIGIIMALMNMGIWALVAQTVSNQILLCITAWTQTGWKPGWNFSRNRLKEILSFGGGILVSELLSYVVESIRTLFIGGYYSAESLSYYDRGNIYPSTLMRGVYDTIGSVLLPIFSKNQDDNRVLVANLKKMISISMFIITPIFAGFAAASDSIVRLLLTDKWAPSVPYIIIFCITYLSQPIQGICRQIIYAKGQSKVVLKSEFIKDIVSIGTLLIALKISVFAIAISFLVSMYFAAFLMMYYVSKAIPIKIYEMMVCTIRSFIYSAIMFAAVYSISFLNIGILLRLVIQIFIGGTVYLGLAFLTKDANLKQCISIIKSLKTKQKITDLQ